MRQYLHATWCSGEALELPSSPLDERGGGCGHGCGWTQVQAAADDEGPEAFFSLAALTAAAQASDDDAEEEEEEEGRSEGSDLDAAIREMQTTGGASDDDADADEDAESDQQAEDGEQVCAASSPLIHPPRV